MRVFIIVVLLGLAPLASADAVFDCGDFEGVWQGERYDAETGTHVDHTITFYPGSSFEVVFSVSDGLRSVQHTEHGYFRCELGRLWLYVADNNGGVRLPAEVYTISLLSRDYFEIERECSYCGMANDINNCGDVVVRSRRIGDASVEFCGC
ncbi:MAG: hypothetical protein AAF351_07765 [Pseudomonadota bacterium]